MEEQVNQGSAASRGDKPGEHASGCNKVAGDGSLELGHRPRLVLKGLSEKVRHMKAVRRLSSYLENNSQLGISSQLGTQIGVKELDALGIVATWLLINEREGGAKDSIVGWSGYTKNWTRRIHQGIRDCERLELLETLKVTGGTRLCITLKGYRVIDLYDKMLEVVQQEFEDSRDKERARRYKMAQAKIGRQAA